MNRRSQIPTHTLVTVVVAGAGLALYANRAIPTEAVGLWIAICVAAECLWVPLPIGQATISMASAANFATLLILARFDALLAIGVAVATTDLAIRRKPLVRAAFNTAQTVLATYAASLVLERLGGLTTPANLSDYGRAILSLPVAALAYWLVNTCTVSLVVGFAEGVSPLGAWRQSFGNRAEAIAAGALFSLGALLAFNYLVVGPLGTFIVILPVIAAFDSYVRRYPRTRTSVEDSGEDSARAA